MSNPLISILTRLDDLTRRERVQWTESGRASELVLATGDVVITLSKNPFTELFANTPPGPFKLSVLSESGTELAALEARNGDAQYAQLKSLFDTAQQQAKRVNDVIVDVERQLAAL